MREDDDEVDQYPCSMGGSLFPVPRPNGIHLQTPDEAGHRILGRQAAV